jgi:hypothetical protein
MSEWESLSKPSALPDGTRDVPLGFCWYCRRRINVRDETWRSRPYDLMAHVDCETLWMASPPGVDRREYTGDEADPANYFSIADLAGYFEALEEFVRNHHPSRRPRYVTEPRLQPQLDARVERMYEDAESRLIGPDNPCRRPGEDDAAYLLRVVSGADDEDDDNDDDERGPGG